MQDNRIRENILKKEGLASADSKAFFCQSTKNSNKRNSHTIDVNIGRHTRTASRDAWERSFRIEQSKGLDPMIMVGTQLADLRSTLKSQADTKDKFISARVSRYTGERASA